MKKIKRFFDTMVSETSHNHFSMHTRGHIDFNLKQSGRGFGGVSGIRCE